jgi:hypothetical protein
MTDQLADQWGCDKSPREIWDEWRQTKYNDDDIGHIILSAITGSDERWVKANALTAQAMIAYNEMIDARIGRAQRTWGLK